MTEDNQNNIGINHNIQIHDKEPEVNEDFDTNTWTATGLMASLPTEIYCGMPLTLPLENKFYKQNLATKIFPLFLLRWNSAFYLSCLKMIKKQIEITANYCTVSHQSSDPLIIRST